MNVERALDQIAEIHAHLARTETYRGYRALPVGLTGVLAILGAILQPRFVPADAPHAYLLFWLALAFAAAGVAAVGIAVGHLAHHRAEGWGRAIEVVGQFIPCLAAGFLVTATLAAHSDLVPLLPGIWALLFSLGIFASRPFLPRLIGWIGLLYFIAGAQLLVLAETGASLAPWSMGLTFGLGQLLTAGVFYWNLERPSHEEAR